MNFPAQALHRTCPQRTATTALEALVRGFVHAGQIIAVPSEVEAVVLEGF